MELMAFTVCLIIVKYGPQGPLRPQARASTFTNKRSADDGKRSCAMDGIVYEALAFMGGFHKEGAAPESSGREPGGWREALFSAGHFSYYSAALVLMGGV